MRSPLALLRPHPTDRSAVEAGRASGALVNEGSDHGRTADGNATVNRDPRPADGATVPAAPRRPGARQRLFQALRSGRTLAAAAVEADVPLALAEVMVDEMQRQGLLDSATALCASGLGACHGGDSEEVRVHCAGCPLTISMPRR